MNVVGSEMSTETLKDHSHGAGVSQRTARWDDWVCRSLMQCSGVGSLHAHGVTVFCVLRCCPFFCLSVANTEHYSDIPTLSSRLLLFQVPVHGGLHALGHHGGDELRRDDTLAEGLLLQQLEVAQRRAGVCEVLEVRRPAPVL